MRGARAPSISQSRRFNMSCVFRRRLLVVFVTPSNRNVATTHLASVSAVLNISLLVAPTSSYCSPPLRGVRPLARPPLTCLIRINRLKQWRLPSARLPNLINPRKLNHLLQTPSAPVTASNAPGELTIVIVVKPFKVFLFGLEEEKVHPFVVVFF